MQKLSIIIPAFNERKVLLATVESVLAADTPGFLKEVLVVDDGSYDGTSTVSLPEGVMMIHHASNLGKGAAVRTGLRQCTGDVALIQDADSEYSPADYAVITEPFRLGTADVVYGDRREKITFKRLPFWMANRLVTTIFNLLNRSEFHDIEVGYKAFAKSVVERISPMLTEDGFGFEIEISKMVALLQREEQIRFVQVPVTYVARTYAQGKKFRIHDGVEAVRLLWKYKK